MFISLDYSGPMTKTGPELLAEIEHHASMAQHHQRKARQALTEYTRSLGQGPTVKAHSIRCIEVWQEWLAANGPATRKHITEVTGVKLTERATPHTVAWDESIDPEMDYPANTLCRVRTIHEGGGRGAPPVLFFLWSQRYDVRDKFGVGPERPTDGVVNSTDVVHSLGPEALGPVVYSHNDVVATVAAVEAFAQPVDTATVEPESDGPARYATMAEWDDAWRETFTVLAQYGGKPSDEQRAEMAATLPDGQNINAALAIAFRDAVREANQSTVLGVVQPPADGDDLDWG